MSTAITEFERKAGGGFRSDERKHTYWLTVEQLEEFERISDAITNDDEFWDWFKTFREAANIGDWASGTSQRRGAVSWDVSKYTEKPKKFLSDWWTGETYKGWGSYISGRDDVDARRLALMLGAVETTVRIVSPMVPAPKVRFADEGQDTSYTDFEGNVLVISPDAVMNKKYEDGEAIDITTGYGLHEGSHSQYTRDVWTTLWKPQPLRPMGVATRLANFLEDVRIERLTSEEFPGFAAYFDKTLAHLWDKGKKHLPKEWGPELQDKLNAILVMLRWPAHVPTALADPSFADEIPWWTEWNARYQRGGYELRQACIDGIVRLSLDPKTKEEMGELGKEEEQEEKRQRLSWGTEHQQKQLQELVDELLKNKSKGKSGMSGCGSHPSGPANPKGKDEKVVQHVSDEVKKLIDSQLQQEYTLLRVEGSMESANPIIYVTRPPEDEYSQSSYIGKPSPLVAKMRAAFTFRAAAPQWSVRGLKSGGIDDDELYRLNMNDMRIFEQTTIEQHPEVAISLLVDLSGSMVGSKLKTAQALSQLFLETLRGMKGVEPAVYGHTGDLAGYGHAGQPDCDIYRIWEKGDPMSRLGLITTLPHSDNYDGHALAWVIKANANRATPDQQRVVIIMSDGHPAGMGYGGDEAYKHVRQVVEWAEKKELTAVIQIAIDPAMDPVRQARMYKHWVPFESNEALPKQMTQLLLKVTK